MPGLKPTAKKHASPQATQKRLVRAAERIPGVAEAMQAYGAATGASAAEGRPKTSYATGANEAQ